MRNPDRTAARNIAALDFITPKKEKGIISDSF
jgi:hypothetical protein